MNDAPIAALHPVSLALTIVLGLALILLPRRWSVLPIVVAATFVPTAQRIVVAGLDFNMLRILLLFAFARVVVRGEIKPLKLLTIDKLLLGFGFVIVAAYSIRFGTTSAVINRLGWAFDALGTYFYCRLVMRSISDALVPIRVAAVCSVVLAVFMSIEWTTGRNLFSVIGGVPEMSYVREGRLRAQGAFAHPIMAGMFAASWVPLFAFLWWGRERMLFFVGMGAALGVVVFSSSSTPLGGLVFGFLGLALWRYRIYMPMVRRAAFVTLVVLHFVREQPVWHLLARINIVGGSTGWHRFHLIDEAINHFGEWWLLGIDSTYHWGYYMADVTNEYVFAGVLGGFFAMALLIAVITAGFSGAGRAAKSRALPTLQRRFSWNTGAMLVVHAASFISVSYFGQMTVIWYLHLAFVATAIEAHRQALRSRRRVTRPVKRPAKGRSAEPSHERRTAAHAKPEAPRAVRRG